MVWWKYCGIRLVNKLCILCLLTIFYSFMMYVLFFILTFVSLNLRGARFAEAEIIPYEPVRVMPA